MDDFCQEHSAHERAIAQHDKRLDAHGGQLDKIGETLSALREIERQNQERLDGHDERLAALESAPARRWENLTNYVLTAIAGIVVGIVMTHFGINI